MASDNLPKMAINRSNPFALIQQTTQCNILYVNTADKHHSISGLKCLIHTTLLYYIYCGIHIVVKHYNSIITHHDPISIRLRLTRLGQGSWGKGNRVLA